MSNNSPIISIIVPIYKAEAYLDRCINSILNQSFIDFELLLIDDGSPDKSGCICDAYAKQDNRVRVFHNENGGVSFARQYGLDNARGEYIIHADPDDWVDNDMLKCLYNKAKEEDADMIICDFIAEYKTHQYYSTQRPSSLDHITVAKELFTKLHGATWNKLIKRQCLIDYSIRFDSSLSFCEDLFFNAQLLLNPIKVSYLNEAFYHYDQCINLNSIVSNYTINTLKYDKQLYLKAGHFFSDTDIFHEAISKCGFLIVHRAFHGGILTSKEYRYNCNPYVKYVEEQSQLSRIMKLFYILSCRGFYRPVYNLYRFISKIKKYV